MSLRAAACRSIEIGDVIVATWEPHETTVLANDSRHGPGAADHFQQRRRDDPAHRRQQGDRACARPSASSGCRITTRWASATPKTTKHF